MKFRKRFVDGSQFWRCARRPHFHPCDGAGCQHVIEVGEWYWQECQGGLKLCRRCAEGSRWWRMPRYGIEEEMVIGSPPESRGVGGVGA